MSSVPLRQRSSAKKENKPKSTKQHTARSKENKNAKDDGTPAASALPTPAHKSASTNGDAELSSSATWASGMLVGAAAFAVYLHTAYPSVSGGDPGELMVAACNWGVAHPPGYPLFTVLSALFVHTLPMGSPAWRVHVCSAALSATAAALLYLSVLRVTRGNWAGGLLAGLGFAFAPTVWWYAIQAEVFPLNNAILGAILLLAVLFFEQIAILREGAHRTKSAAKGSSAAGAAFAEEERLALKYAYWGAFFCGLALTNQHTTVFYVAAVVLTVVLTLIFNRLLSGVVVLRLTVSILAGVAPYLYLPLASSRRPMDSWGDQRSWQGFVHHFLRREYGTFQLAADSLGANPGMLFRLQLYFRSLMTEEGLFVVPLLAALGAIWMLLPSCRLRLVQACLLLGYLLYVGVFHYLANLNPLEPLYLGVQARFWIQANLYVFFWAGVGLHCVGVLLTRLRSTSGFPFVTGKLVTVLSCLVAMAFVSAQLGLHWHQRNHRDSKVFAAFGTSSLRSFPDNAVVFLNGDLNNNLIKYPQQCEGMRRNLTLVSLQLMSWNWFVPMQRHNYPAVTFPKEVYHPFLPEGFSLAQFMAANWKKHSFFLCGPFKDGDQSHVGLYETVPFGLCDRIVRAPLPGQRVKIDVARFRRGVLSVPSDEETGPYDASRYTADSWETVAFLDIWRRRLYVASWSAFQYNQDRNNTELLRVAAMAFDRAFPSPSLEAVWLRLGVTKAEHYRDSGVVFGQESERRHQLGDSKGRQRYERKMMRQWTEFLRLEPDNAEISPLVRGQINPYVGAKIEGALDAT